MSAPVVQTQGKARAGYQKVLKIREECEMRFAIGMAKVNSWLPESFAKKSSVKLLGGLAVGAMLIMATTFTYDQLRRDEITEASQASAYWVQRAEAEEMAYDELSKNFVGIAAPSSENSQELQASAYWVQRAEAEEIAYDELSKNFIGIPSPDTKITGRFLSGEDLRFMIQYLNELKEDEVTNSMLNDVRQIK
jgi:hypothetical protein